MKTRAEYEAAVAILKQHAAFIPGAELSESKRPNTPADGRPPFVTATIWIFDIRDADALAATCATLAQVAALVRGSLSAHAHDDGTMGVTLAVFGPPAEESAGRAA